MKKLTPVLLADAIEPAIPFWVDRLGYEKTMQVEEGDRLGFAAFKRGAVEVMYQTPESVRNDIEALADVPVGAAFLFVEVEDLDEVAGALDGIEPVIPRRKTFYGSEEIVVREPGGNVVIFAYFPPKE